MLLKLITVFFRINSDSITLDNIESFDKSPNYNAIAIQQSIFMAASLSLTLVALYVPLLFHVVYSTAKARQSLQIGGAVISLDGTVVANSNAVGVPVGNERAGCLCEVFSTLSCPSLYIYTFIHY